LRPFSCEERGKSESREEKSKKAKLTSSARELRRWLLQQLERQEGVGRRASRRREERRGGKEEGREGGIDRKG